MKKRVLLLFISLILLFSALNAQDKLVIAVLDLQALNVPATDAIAISDRIRHELYQTGRFTVLEREAVNEILKEQGFQMSMCTTSECLVQVGKMLGAQQMVGGNVSKTGNLYSIMLKMIDVGTGEIKGSATADIEGSIEKVVTSGTKEVAQKLTSGVAPAVTKKEEPKKPVVKETKVKEEPKTAAQQPTGEKKKKSKTWLIVGGVVLVGGAAAAVLASSGSDNGGGGDTGTLVVKVPQNP